jgi:FlaA1/EpsC-like NDP-sugar epimerase
MTRAFTTVAEVVPLVLEAAVMARGGEVFVLDLGKPVRVLDVAQELIRGHGFAPGKDIEVVFSGLAPGERLHEKLFDHHEAIWKTSHPQIFTATNGAYTVSELERVRTVIKTVEHPLRRGDAIQVREALAALN